MKAEKLGVEQWDIAHIKPYELNVKNHDKKQVEKIAKSITEFGWVGNPIVVNEDGVILAGHGRRLAALSLNMAEVPVQVICNLTPDAQRAYRLADNRVAISDIDSEMLQKELDGIDFDMDGIFDKKELDFLVADLSEMNMDAFVNDLDVEVANQSAETAAKIEEVDGRDVKVDKALGFKTFKGRDERHVAKFLAHIEASTNKLGADAFVTFVRSFMQSQAAT